MEEKVTCKDFLQVQKEGNREVQRKYKFYNLNAIISVGYHEKKWIQHQQARRIGIKYRQQHNHTIGTIVNYTSICYK